MTTYKTETLLNMRCAYLRCMDALHSILRAKGYLDCAWLHASSMEIEEFDLVDIDRLLNQMKGSLSVIENELCLIVDEMELTEGDIDLWADDKEKHDAFEAFEEIEK